MGLESRSKKLEVASTQSTVSRLGGDRVATMTVARLPCAGREKLKRAHPPGTRSAMNTKHGLTSVSEIKISFLVNSKIELLLYPSVVSELMAVIWEDFCHKLDICFTCV